MQVNAILTFKYRIPRLYSPFKYYEVSGKEKSHRLHTVSTTEYFW